VPFFNASDLAGWEPGNPAANHWIAQNGELLNTRAGANIRALRKVGDFKLRIEYNCPPGGNSGVYLRGRYEVQAEYEPPTVGHANAGYHDFAIPPGAPTIRLSKRRSGSRRPKLRDVSTDSDSIGTAPINDFPA
jgi:hypothetical protein